MTKPALAMGLIVFLLAGTAAADDAATPVGRPFVMPGLDEKASTGVEFQYASYEYFGTDVTVVTLDAVVEVLIDEHLVMLGRVPIAFVDADSSFLGECCDNALGNVTLGARFRQRLRPASSGMWLGAVEASISLPTVSDGYAGFAGLYAGRAQSPHDAARYLPNLTAIRGSGFLYRGIGRAFFEGELGLHVWFEEEPDSVLLPPTGETHRHTKLKVGLAGGVFLTRNVAVLAELSNWVNLSDLENDGDGDESLIHAIDIGVRVHGDWASMGARLYVPLDETFRDANLIGLGLDARSEF